MYATYDLLVVGGGINGAGIARDAAGRGLSVLLCEQDDLGAHTSSASTKLIHGGLRYLEHWDFGLVRKALQEREILLASAPHIMWPMRFVMPHAAHLRPAWMIRAGLFLYDNLARRQYLPGSASIDLKTHPAGQALESRYTRGFIYSDGWVDDARLVVLNAVDAAERGARILTRTRCVKVERQNSTWLATLESDGERMAIQARALVNATGPWVDRFLRYSGSGATSARQVRLVKGSHIVVRRLFQHRFAYIFQNPDKRILFAIPYERDFTLIGTTDVDYRADPGTPRIDTSEIQYLCAMANEYFQQDLSEKDVVWSYSGVRPLLEDASREAASVTRDYQLELDTRGAPILSVFGGKITTYRRLAEEAVDKLAPRLNCRAPRWTAHTKLPGGDLPTRSFAPFLRIVKRRYPWLPSSLRYRLARAYGSRIDRVLGHAASLADLGEEVAPQLYAREIEYLRRTEWARTAEDILWRRSKLGLHLPPGSEARLTAWLRQHHSVAIASSATLTASEGGS